MRAISRLRPVETTCCGVPEDLYDLVIVAESERQLAEAFAAAFLGRDRHQRVAVVLPSSEGSHLHAQAVPPGRRQDSRAQHRTLLPRHAARKTHSRHAEHAARHDARHDAGNDERNEEDVVIVIARCGFPGGTPPRRTKSHNPTQCESAERHETGQPGRGRAGPSGSASGDAHKGGGRLISDDPCR